MDGDTPPWPRDDPAGGRPRDDPAGGRPRDDPAGGRPRDDPAGGRPRDDPTQDAGDAAGAADGSGGIDPWGTPADGGDVADERRDDRGDTDRRHDPDRGDEDFRWGDDGAARDDRDGGRDDPWSAGGDGASGDDAGKDAGDKRAPDDAASDDHDTEAGPQAEPGRDEDVGDAAEAAQPGGHDEPDHHDRDPDASQRRGLAALILGRRRKPRKKRPHPFSQETSPDAEHRVSPVAVTALWAIGSLVMVLAGLWLQARYGYINNENTLHHRWEFWNGIPLFAGIALLIAGLPKWRYRHHVALVGWILFAGYWAMTAKDFFIREESDYVNMTAAMLAVFFLNYLAYHEWLNVVRGVTNFATRYLAIVASFAAGFYFLIAKITPFRIWLIERVGEQTRTSLDLFGFGDKMGLQFHIDKFDIFGPVLFHYPDTYCDPRRSDPIGDWCADEANRDAWVNSTHYQSTPYERTVAVPEVSDSWWDQLLYYAPDGDLRIIPVSIVLACTAIQTIALFWGLFLGTKAPLKTRLWWSLGIGALIYVLNLLRNTLVIWAYGRGHMSFFMVHNVLAKILTLGALIGIALWVFKRFPAFLDALGSVLDLPDRDGPIERTLRIGRRRPGA